MSVQIDSRRYCPVAPIARQGASSNLLPWAIVVLMLAYIAGSHLFGSASASGDIASLDRPGAQASPVLSRLGDSARRMGGQIAVYGQVRNTSGRALRDVEALVELYDAGGRMVAVAHGLTTDRQIARGASTSFEAYADDGDNVAGYRVRFQRLGGGSIGP